MRRDKGVGCSLRSYCLITVFLSVGTPRDGNWGAWSGWTNCSRTCNGGTRIRYRFCDSPSPQYGGKVCEGERLLKEPCNEEPCPRKCDILWVYYMASSVSGQDESNPALWLATRAGKMEPSCPLGTTRLVPQEKFSQKPYNKSFIDQACSVKMAWYWPRSFFACLWTSTSSRSINTQKKNSANIQPSWPHTWSITHTYWLTGRGQSGNICLKVAQNSGHHLDFDGSW